MTFLHPLYILIIFLTVVKSDLQLYQCDQVKNYTANSTYARNLNQLEQSLLSSIIQNNGFTNDTAGNSSDQVFGLGLCRPDVTGETCRGCLRTTVDQAQALCQYSKTAAIWYELCFLRYSDTDFFSTPGHVLHGWCGKVDVADPQQFHANLNMLMSHLSSQAANSSQLVAAGYYSYTRSITLYGLVQCTRDLSNNDCYQCLQESVSAMKVWCWGKLGGKILGPSCFIQYENFPFYDISAVPNEAASLTSNTTTSGSSKVKKLAVLVGVPVVVAALLILFAICAYLRWVRKKNKLFINKPYDEDSIGRNDGSLLFELSTLRSATDDFSEDNKLGEGGFGQVYKGTLLNGKEIAVKRLSRSSQQGLEELRNEVKLLAKLQHKNLVKLFGCCLDGLEKLLVFEYLSNTSLDKFLFDPDKCWKLDWTRRLNIIEGIGRGLMYLHEDSRLRIIHRDLKASNILLDADMNPKISDFGLAKLFINIDETHANTSRIAGTYGYMAPEYAMRGQFSTKSDVFSYGILLLEIVTGRTVYRQEDETEEDLLSYVWHHWEKGDLSGAIDKSVSSHCPSQELIRCIHVGLLCVQDDPSERPNMASVLHMLRSESMTLPAPSAPPFLFSGANSAGCSQISLTEKNYGNAMSENVDSGKNTTDDE